MIAGMTLRSAVRSDLDPGELAAAARSVGDALAIGFRVGDEAITYCTSEGSIEVIDGVEDAHTVVALSRAAWDDLVAQHRTFINLFLAEELTFERGGFEHLAAWDPALRFLHAQIPVYDPTRADLGGRDPEASFTLDASDDELRAQLTAMGYLHLRGVFSTDEMRAVNAEVDRLAELARPGDDQSWWVTGAEGEDVLCRLLYTSMHSDVMATIEEDPRIARLGALLDPTLRIARDRMEGSPVLLKAPGDTVGLSNIPWHQDCGMGGHGIICPSVAIGIQITGSSADTGNLTVVPGSHGQTLHYQWERRMSDVPVVAIDTEPGDVTLHIQDVMHASPKPEGVGGRRTMYVTFLPPKLWDHVGPGEAFNDLVRNRQQQVASLQ